MEESKRLIRQFAGRLARGKAEPDFFELVRRLENCHPELPRIGYAQVLLQESVRFGQLPYLHFPQASLASIEELTEKDGQTAEALILVYFFGLYGVNGPMPLEITNYVFERYFNEYDSGLRRFSDIIHHCFLSFFYRAWSQPRLAVCFDRPETCLPMYLLRALTGVPFNSTLSPLPKYASETYVSHLSCCVRSAAGLTSILENFLQIPVELKELVTSKESIPNESKTYLGKNTCGILGKNIQLGSYFFTKNKVFEIMIGPTTFEECESFLPGTKGFKQISALIKLYLDRPLDWKLRFFIKRKTLPRPILNGKYQLSRSLWIGRPNSSPSENTELLLDGGRCDSFYSE